MSKTIPIRRSDFGVQTDQLDLALRFDVPTRTYHRHYKER